MTTLGVDKPRVYETGDQNDLPMIASDIIYEGAAVGLDGSGNARPLNAGDKFVGFAIDNFDNSSGLAGAVNARVKSFGAIQLAISGLAATDVGKPVYASDDDTFTLTQSSNSYIGRVKRYVSSGVGIVEFDAANAVGGIIVGLTDNSGGNGSGNTIAAITTVTSTVQDAVAVLAAKVNEIIKTQK